MIYLITAFILWKLDAGLGWWIAYGVVVFIQSSAILYNARKGVKPLLKANGKPYTDQDLEFIWQHGYKTAEEVINSTKQ